MTIETRCFIGLDDFVGIELACLDCGGKSVIPLGKVNLLAQCPLCAKPWFSGERDSRREKINQFFWALDDLQKASKTFKTDGINLSIRFEIRNGNER